MKFTDYEFRETEVTCDNCGDCDCFEGTDYSDVNEGLRSEGWIVRNVDGEWVDFCCQECYEEYMAERMFD